ncbi:MAG: PEGA domain-containing protein [bacterium]
MRRSLMVGLVILGVGISSPARAELKVSVLDLEAGPGAAKVAQRITSTLRRQVANTTGMSLASTKTLAEIKLIFGCVERPRRAYHRCLAKVGISMMANRVIVGKVRVVGGAYKVVLTLLDVQRPLRPNTVSERISLHSVTEAALAGHTRTWFNRLFGLDREGTLAVTCNREGVAVTVGERPAGTCGMAGSRITAKPGTHRVVFSKNGFQTTTRMVTIAAGRTSRLTIEMTKTDRPVVDRIPPRRDGGEGVTPPKGEKKKDPRLTYKVLFYTTLSVGAALLVSSIFTGLQVKKYEQDKLDQIDRLHAENPPRYPDEENACKGNANSPELVDICNKGTNMAVITNVLIGLGAALVGTSAVFLYYAYIKKSSAERANADNPAFQDPTRAKVMVTPQIWVNGGGVSATLRF